MTASPADSSGRPVAPSTGALGERGTHLLDFERAWWKYAGSKDEGIREQFGMSTTRYYQALNALLDDPAAMAYDALLVKRLRRERDRRQRERSARRLQGR
ncbi:Protein of unknown function [Raineyella antarctica]|uniref:DUF3263 domain-containing protein n=1 Tax=Raineyella antarctica TaxID=1577474 RepID=A0A1G6GEA5_9ACTN|nr:DUF3263 domain-containing protein [Raineyella antarctica]SDB80307.1 Protein of unknown function [Raineyella antarctica]